VAEELGPFDLDLLRAGLCLKQRDGLVHELQLLAVLGREHFAGAARH
jgi:hypothetical protein